MTYRDLDVNKWARLPAYELFKGYADPFFNFSAGVDVTSAYEFVKENELSYSLTMLYCSLAAANQIREFRIRLVEDRLVEFDIVHATQTILNQDESFSFAYFEKSENVFEFNEVGRLAMKKYLRLKTFDVEAGRHDLIYYSVIPWVSFTSFKHASQLDPKQTIPRIVFGKRFDDRGIKRMPVSVEANHMIMDGLHVGRFFNYFQEALNSL